MAGTPLIFETVESQQYVKTYAGGDLTAEWVVWYVPSLVEAETLLWETISNPLATGYGNLEVKSVRGRNLGAPDLWLFTVLYGSSVPAGAFRPDQLTFRIAANETHITNSITTLDQRVPADAAVSGTNLTVSAGDDTIVTPDGYAPVVGDVNKWIAITGGLGWITGLYQITFVSGGQWVLSASAAPVLTVGGVWTFLNGSGPSFGGAIGVSQDSVAGTTVNTPAMEFTITQNYPDGITLAALDTFRSCVGCINIAPFGVLATGTVEYLGGEPTSPDGSMVDNQDFVFWNVAHRFRYEPDVFNVVIGTITVPYKPGHAYLWVRYAPVAAGNVLTVPPVQVNIEQVKLYADFSVLGITLP